MAPAPANSRDKIVCLSLRERKGRLYLSGGQTARPELTKTGEDQMIMRRAGFLSCLAVLVVAFLLSSCSSKKPTETTNPLGPSDTTSQTDTTDQVDTTDHNTGPEIDWVSTSVLYEKSLQEHEQSLLFIMVGWCIHCQHLKENTLTDSSVIALINSSFNAVKIDGDSQEEVAYRDSTVTEYQMTRAIYHTTGYPTIIVLDSDGNETERMGGERGPAALISELNQMLGKH
jgi:thioredoxin-related protein